jgi:chorismate synthase
LPFVLHCNNNIFTSLDKQLHKLYQSWLIIRYGHSDYVTRAYQYSYEMKSRGKQAHTQARWSFRAAAAAAIAGREHTAFLLLRRRRAEPAKNGTSPRRPPA